MSINGIDKVESKNKKTKIIKIPLHYQNSNNENPNLHMSLNKYFQNNQISKLKIGFNHNLKKEIKTLKTSSCLEKTTETPFQNKINTNRHFDFLRNKFQSINNKMNNYIENKNDIISNDENNRVTLNKTFKINPNLKNKKTLFVNSKQTRNEKNENINKIEENNTEKKIIFNNIFKKKYPFKLSDTFFEKFYNEKENLFNKQRNYSVENNEKNKSNGFYNFLSRAKLSNLPILVTNNSNLNNDKKTILNLTEKEKYEKLTETFLKLKCLLSLDCEPGKEREYIKNFFKRFGYNIITENNITNFLNFINIEPFPLDPNKSLKDNILLAMNYEGNENDYDIDNYDNDNDSDNDNDRDNDNDNDDIDIDNDENDSNDN